MDVMDAGVYVSKWEAAVPKHTKMTLWGPLQAKEMGLDGWEVQDGGETGFVMHNPGVRLTMGRATSTLIFVRRLERAFLTVYFGGYPTDAPGPQRKLDMQKVVGACEIFLAKLAKDRVRFEFQGEIALVDNSDDATAVRGGARAPSKAIGGGKLSKSGDIIDADEELAKKAGYVSVTESKKTKKATGRSDEPEAEHVDGAPSWVRVPKSAKGGKVIDADVVAKKTSGKDKNEVWEV
ncbi:MAG: hypothetical protein AABY18_02555 [Candidatus Thermoplasmatota archaeon]